MANTKAVYHNERKVSDLVKKLRQLGLKSAELDRMNRVALSPEDANLVMCMLVRLWKSKCS